MSAAPNGPTAEEPGADLGIMAIDHIGLAVPDLAAAVSFHCDVLGLHLLHSETNSEQGVAEAMLGAGSGDSGTAGRTQIQLLAPLDKTSALARFLSRSGPGIQHLAYSVRDVERAAEVLRGKGLRLLYDAAKSGTRGSRINFVHPKDAGGVLIELVELVG
jgi:methylmalonyl-CoA/ethylmalonyl-CoA epimerase